MRPLTDMFSVSDKFPAGKRWNDEPFCIFAVNYVLLIFFIGAPTALVTVFLMNPNGSMYAYSALPDDWKSSSRALPVFVLYEAIMVFWIFSNMSAYFVYWCSSVFQNLIWLDLLIRYDKMFAAGSKTSICYVLNTLLYLQECEKNCRSPKGNRVPWPYI